MVTIPPPLPHGDGTDADGWRAVSAPVCARGESPVWRGLEDRLYWLDSGLNRLWRLHLPSGRSEWIELPATPGALAPCRQGGWLLALRDGLYHLPQWQMPLERLAEAPYDTRRLRFHDGKCDPWGRFWIGSGVEADERPDGGLYCLRARDRQRPELALILSGIGRASGLAWPPDGKWLYCADSGARTVYTLPMNRAGQWPPALGMRLILKRFETASGHADGGRPAGAAVDSAGNYWVAMDDGGRVVCLSPTGHVLADWPLPARCPTGLCFGGRDLRTLFVTTAREHRSAAELSQYPDSGAVFARPVPLAGLPPATYWD